MKSNSFINNGRRIVLHRLTKSISIDKGELKLEECKNIKRILIVRPNSRLGNQLMVTPLIQEIERLFPKAKFDIFVRSRIASILFQNYKGLDQIITLPSKPFKQIGSYVKTWIKLVNQRYDLVINVANGSSSGRLMTGLSRSKHKLFCDINQEIESTALDCHHMAKHPVYCLRHFVGQSNITQPKIPTLSIQLTQDEISNGVNIIDSIVGSKRKTIGIYTFATGAKCFSKEWWADTYQKLVDEFGEEYNILEVLPIENVSQIDFKAPSYYSRDIREMLGVMDNLEAFVTADCGIMHLASATKVPVLSIFSMTSPEIYRPYNRGSIDLKANELKDNDEIIETLKYILRHK